MTEVALGEIRVGGHPGTDQHRDSCRPRQPAGLKASTIGRRSIGTVAVRKQPAAADLVQIRHSKTDQEGVGHEIVIPRGCRIEPVKAITAWLAASEITTGFVFRPILKGGRLQAEPLTGHSAAAVVKQYAKLAGLDPALFAGHSLRSGFLTSGAEAGASALKLIEVSQHKSLDMLTTYVRRSNLFREHAGVSFL